MIHRALLRDLFVICILILYTLASIKYRYNLVYSMENDMSEYASDHITSVMFDDTLQAETIECINEQIIRDLELKGVSAKFNRNQSTTKHLSISDFSLNGITIDPKNNHKGAIQSSDLRSDGCLNAFFNKKVLQSCKDVAEKFSDTIVFEDDQYGNALFRRQTETQYEL